MKKYFFIAFMSIVGLLFTTRAYSKTDTYAGQLINWNNLAIASSCTVPGAPVYNLSGGYSTLTYKTKSLNGYVKFWLNTDSIPAGLTAFTATVTVKVVYYPEDPNASATLPPVTVFKTLTVNYDPATGVKYKNAAVENFENAAKIEATVQSILVNNGPPSLLQKQFMLLQTFIYHERYYNYNNVFGGVALSILPAPVAAYDAVNNELTISWAGENFAEGYELEYTFVDDYGNNAYNTSFIPANQLNFSFWHNSTRILTEKTSYTMPLVEEHGYLVFRVRGYGRAGADFDRIFFGRYYATVAGDQAFNVAAYPYKFYVNNAQTHVADKMNWQSVTTFAEEGKSQTVVKYLDGAMRTRQTVTAASTEHNAIVAETIYDFEGRPAVNVLPAPVNTAAIKYYPNFNRNLNDQPYSYADFSLKGSNDCDEFIIKPLKQNDNIGAGNYYSPFNNNKTVFNAYIPNANGYPFTTATYMPDPTGRVVRQGGVGEIFQPGNTGQTGDSLYQSHDTKYFYGKPNQQELDRLFGTNVGYAAFYQKNLVVDGNGQATVSYVDLNGKTIATALAGQAPANLAQLASYHADSITNDLLDAAPVLNNAKHSVTSSQSFLVSANNTPYHFNYNISANTFNALSCSNQNYCLDCLYDLEIAIVKDDCGKVEYSNTKTLGRLSEINFTCNDANASGSLSFDVTLGIGSYTVTKKLVVNKAAAELYADSIINDPANHCLKTFNDFYNEAWANRDTNRCKPACDACTAESAGAGTASQIAQAVQACDSLWCKPQAGNFCDMARISMINDLTPGGQYARYTDANGNISRNAGGAISIFYQGGTGIRNISNTSLVQNIPVSLPGQATHPLSYYMANDSVFAVLINNWPDGLSEQLLPLHPEYCYLQFCDLPATQNSGEFDTKCINANTYADAQAAGLNISAANINIFYQQDPFYQYLLTLSNTTLAADMQAKFSNYTGQNNSIVQMAVFLANCPSGNNINACAGTWGNGVDDNEEWEGFKSLYYAVKQEFVQKAREYFVISSNCCPGKNAYIGCKNGNCNIPAVWPLSQQQNNYPCFGTANLPAIYNLYKDAEKRFTTINDVQFPGMPSPPAQSVYNTPTTKLAQQMQSIDSTGICPTCPELDAFKMMIAFIQIKKWIAGNATVKADEINGLTNVLRQRFIGSQSNENIRLQLNEYGAVTISSNKCTITIKADTAIDWKKAEILPTCLEIQDYRHAKLHVMVNGAYKTVLNITATCDIFYCEGKAPNNTTVVQAQCTCDVAYNGKTLYQIGNVVNYKNTCYIVKKIDSPAGLTPGTAPGNEKYWELLCNTAGNKDEAATLTQKKKDRGNKEKADTIQRYIPQTTCGCNALCDIPQPTPDLPFINCDSLLMEIATQQANEAYTQYKDSVFNALLTGYYAKCMQSIETFSSTYVNAEYHYTLYYYDQSHNLVQTVPPAGVSPITNTAQLANVTNLRNSNSSVQQLPAHFMQSQYRHNSLDAAVWQQTPDAGVTEFFYDKLGRIALSQNAKQKPANKASYTYYDNQGRNIEAGQIDVTGIASLKNAAFDYNTWVTFVNSRSRTEITHTYYDVTAKPQINNGFGTAGQQNLRSRIGSVILFDNNTALAAFTNNTATTLAPYSYAIHYTYDIEGNITGLLQDFGKYSIFGFDPYNVRLQSKYISYGFDLVSGNVNRVNYQPGYVDQFFYQYQYNADNKLTAVFTSANNIIWENDARYSYFRHGLLARMELGTDKVQGLDYAYTLQGWIKGVNGYAVGTQSDIGKDGEHTPALPNSIGYYAQNSHTAPDTYSYWLGYFKGDYQAIGNSTNTIANTVTRLTTGMYNDDPASLYNGNIRSMFTNLPHYGGLGMEYHYDQLNRLIKQDAFDLTANAPLANHAYSMALSYDASGNIQTLMRNGAALMPAMDNLTYTYYNNNSTTYTGNPATALATNKLASITDGVSSSNYPADIDNQQALNYTYDAIGNLVSDNQEGIVNIEWNLQNKVQRIKKNNHTTISYTYDPLGNRVGKTITNDSTHQITQLEIYTRDAQGNTLAIYQKLTDSTLLKDQQLYGVARIGVHEQEVLAVNYLIGNTYRIESWRNATQYELTNHLGNVLATITDSRSNSNTATAISATDYYAFGMAMPGRSYNIEVGRYGFNGLMKSPEVNDNHYTAKYGEYNAETGIRENCDPKPNASFSFYSMYGDNPIWRSDILLDTPTVKEKRDVPQNKFAPQISNKFNLNILTGKTKTPADNTMLDKTKDLVGGIGIGLNVGEEMGMENLMKIKASFNGEEKIIGLKTSYFGKATDAGTLGIDLKKVWDAADGGITDKNGKWNPKVKAAIATYAKDGTIVVIGILNAPAGITLTVVDMMHDYANSPEVIKGISDNLYQISQRTGKYKDWKASRDYNEANGLGGNLTNVQAVFKQGNSWQGY